MLTVTFIETVYPAPNDEDDYCPDGQGSVDTVVMGFRELVFAMREYPIVSCSPARGTTYEWLMSETEQDYRTGEYTEKSLHYSHDNPPRCAKYWRLAMKAAGQLK